MSSINQSTFNSGLFRVGASNKLTSLATQLSSGLIYGNIALSPSGKTLAVAKDQLGPSTVAKSLILKSVATGGINKTIAFTGAPGRVTWTATGAQVVFDNSGSQSTNAWHSTTVSTGNTTTVASASAFHNPVRRT